MLGIYVVMAIVIIGGGVSSIVRQLFFSDHPPVAERPRS